MTAFSERDLDQAFACAERGGLSESVAAVKTRVLSHLDGGCTCNVNRCKGCGQRDLNGIPRHKKGCKFGGKKR